MFTSTRYPSAENVDVNICTNPGEDDDVHSGSARAGPGPPGADGPPAAPEMAGAALRPPPPAGVCAVLPFARRLRARVLPLPPPSLLLRAPVCWGCPPHPRA